MPSRHALTLVVMLILPRPAVAAETLWTQVTVRVYDNTGAPAAERRIALEIARSIVSATSVELIWRTCDSFATREPPVAGHEDPCRTPLGPRELAVRILRSRTSDQEGRGLPLGDALINVNTGTGVLATIYSDRVDRLAAKTGVDRDTLLGRAIAHELGHLLMATSSHAAHGLMRAIWSPEEIQRRHMTDWIFRPLEIAAIKARIGTDVP
jgi:hypothetical protein